MSTFHVSTSLEAHWRWIFAVTLVSISVVAMILTICLVPFPKDLLQANYSSSQLSPYDHLNLAMTVTLMQLTVPVTAALLLRYHTDCQRDMTILLVATWTGEMTLAAKHLLHFWGFDQYGLGVPAALAGILWVGFKAEHLLINVFIDCAAVLSLDFGISHLKLLLRIEVFITIFIVLISLFDEIFLSLDILRIIGSFFCWAFLFLGIYFSCCLVGGVNSLVHCIDHAKDLGKTTDEEIVRAMSKVRSYRRSLVIFSTTRLLILARVMLFGGYLWPVPAHMAEKVYENQGSSFATYLLTDSSLASNLWFLALLLGVLYLVGLHSVSATHRRHEENQARLRKRAERRKTYEPAQDAGWQEKVEDLAKRAISLDALLTFYSGLGRDYMHNFDSKVHTTDDVVRQAIIPLSALHQSDMSMLSMKGRRVRPGAMVTHTWHSRFRDLVAACCADGLEESNYLRISLLLDTDMDLIRHWLRRCGELKSTYWICAFCVNQHKGICHPSFPLYDSATGATVKPCECNCPKYLNTDPPCRSDLAHPISINCEMNKFSDMIAWLAATDDEFRQVLVVDANLELFSRAWCMAEIAEAYMMGMKQLLKIESGNALQQRNAKLKALRIEDMKASRAEDVQEILHRIPDKDEFNRQLQRLFGKLFGTFWHLHPSERLKIACRELRWQLHSQEQEDIDGSISSLEENTMPEAKV